YGIVVICADATDSSICASLMFFLSIVCDLPSILFPYTTLFRSVRHGQVHLGAAVGAGADRGTPAVPGHPLVDGAADPVPVPGDLLRVEALTAVADEHLAHSGTYLHVHRHRRRTVLHGVDQRQIGRAS